MYLSFHEDVFESISQGVDTKGPSSPASSDADVYAIQTAPSRNSGNVFHDGFIKECHQPFLGF